MTNHWTTDNINGEVQLDKYYRHTCAYLKPNNLIVVYIDDGNAGLFNVTSFTWTKIALPTKNGVIFNSDANEESVFYVGPAIDVTGHSTIL